MAGLILSKWTLANQQDIGVLKWKQRQTLSKVLYEHYDLIVRNAHHGSQDFLPYYQHIVCTPNTTRTLMK